MADDAVLSDVDGDDDPAPLILPSTEIPSDDPRVRALVDELDRERQARRAAEDGRAELQASLNRLKALAHEVIKKRDEALRDKDEAARAADRAAAELAESQKQRDSLRSEMEAAAQMLASGIDKISEKVSAFKNFSAGGLPKSQKYATGLPAVAYGVIKRANDIAEELARQIEAASKSRDQAREQMEQRNYEIAIEVSQLEAAISGLREEAAAKGGEVDRLEKLLAERDSKITEIGCKATELQKSCEEFEGKLRNLEAKVEAQRPLLIELMKNTSKTYEQIQEIIRSVDVSTVDQLDSFDSLFMWQEMDMDGYIRTLLEGTKSVYESAKVAAERVREGMMEKREEAKALIEKLDGLLTEKQHIGTLLRSALSSKTNEELQVAEDGLREAGIDLKLNGHDKDGSEKEEDEVYTLAGAVENTVKASQLKIIELQHLVEALRAESSLLKARLDSQAKEISHQKHHIKELEERERIANESVEGLMMDIAAAEEEITRWKSAAEQEASAGRAVEQDYLTQLSALRQELDEAKQALLELENKLKFKEETAAAAMAARDAAEKSLRLADLTSTRLRERVEELTRQMEEFDGRGYESRNQNNHRYVCWPWQWLGLKFVRYQNETQPSSNEMELSEPLI